MSYYTPTYIKKYETGLVQDRVNFLIPDDAYPILENFYVWRESLLRKPGTELLGRLQRDLENESTGTTDGSGDASVSLRTTLFSTETNAQIVPGTLVVTDGTNIH